MKKTVLKTKTAEVKSEIHDALQLVWDNTNKGQRSKLMKNKAVSELLLRYNVNTDE